VTATQQLNFIKALDIDQIPLDRISVSPPHLFKHNTWFMKDTWDPWFERLRREAPVYDLAHSVNGPFCSVPLHETVMTVDTNHAGFPSEAGGIGILDADTPERRTPTETSVRNHPQLGIRVLCSI